MAAKAVMISGRKRSGTGYLHERSPGPTAVGSDENFGAAINVTDSDE
jgi:hypothetical protein